MKLIFAPMATLSHEAMRRTISRFGGCTEYYTEMIHVSSLVAGGQYEPFYIRTGPEPEKIVWQLTGNNLEDFSKATEIVCALGGIGVDINMGCCAPEIVRSGAGIAWMKKPLDETAKLLNTVKSVLDKNSTCNRLSVKFRLGDEDWTEKSFYEFVDMLVAEGVSQFVLHPRTRKEKLCRPPRLKFCDDLAMYIKTKYGKTSPDGFNYSVIVNGGIKDFDTAQNANKVCPNCDGLMLARAAVQKPWVFSEIQCKERNENFTTPIDLYEIARQFLTDLQKCQPHDFWRTRGQRFFAYYCDNFMFANQLKSRILQESDLEKMLKHLSDYFEKMPEQRFVNKQ